MRVRRSFGFVDLCGFTHLTDTEGDEEAVRLLAEFRIAVREVCSRRAVRIAKWLGDGAMLVCVEVAPLVGTVVELQHRVTGSPLVVRAGLPTGDVILFEGDDYIGTAVNLAARLCELAGPDEVLATEEVAIHAPPWVTVSRRGEVEIRGLTKGVHLVEFGHRPDGDGLEVDPVCGMALPSAAVVTTRRDPAGGVVPFCSESCAETWEGRVSSAPSDVPAR